MSRKQSVLGNDSRRFTAQSAAAPNAFIAFPWASFGNGALAFWQYNIYQIAAQRAGLSFGVKNYKLSREEICWN